MKKLIRVLPHDSGDVIAPEYHSEVIAELRN